MAKPSPVTGQETTRDIPTDEWIPFLAEFTRENRGAHAVLEVFGEGVGRQVATEDRPFDGIAADVKDRERSVWISFGSRPTGQFSHGVPGATAIRVRQATADHGAAMEIDSRDGTMTLLTLSKPEDYALPPAESGKKLRTR